MAVSHYGTNPPTRDEWYRASNAVAEWLGLYGWVEIAQMRQHDEAGLRKLLEEAWRLDGAEGEVT